MDNFYIKTRIKAFYEKLFMNLFMKNPFMKKLKCANFLLPDNKLKYEKIVILD